MSYNLNPTDKVIQAAKDVYNAADGISAKADGAFIKVTWSDFAILMLFINDMSEALTAYEKSKEEQQSVIPKDSEEAMRAFALIYYQGNPPKSGAWYASWRKCIEWIKLTDEIKQARPAPTQEPESKEGKMREIFPTWEQLNERIVAIKEYGYPLPNESQLTAYKHGWESCWEWINDEYASQQVSKATKDLTDEVERLKARIGELEKQNNELKNIDDCQHENVDMKSLRCTICLECGKIIDVID